jgi:lipopolysaccharide/colanic/teichoic acid biosynthesis glycosyltransferase
MKRFFDVFVALSGLIVLSPVFIFIMLLVFIFIGRPIFFIQVRPGLLGKPFNIYKFKSMINPSSDGLLDKDDNERMTRLGRILRALSLDEIPQLWNVLKGDMSLVGPRPLLMDYLPLYNERQFRRHEVRPGVTGWAQVNGRNNLSWGEKFEFDIWYVDNASFFLDLKILFMTVKKVLGREGVTSKGYVSSVRFEGNDK